MARSGDTGALGERLAAGVPVNLTNGSGDTLLILAAYYKQPATVELLLERGADPARVNDRGQTALGAATFRREVAIVQTLLAAGADPHAGDPSAVQIAEFFDLPDMAELLGSQS
nr:ankyrin repeat domain-containing protein [Kineosporia rhizophila]